MATVTLTGHLGSMGTIATRVAAGLDYTLADRELLLESAQALGWSESEVAALDERTRGQGGRLARFLREFGEHGAVAGDYPGLGGLLSTTYADAAAVAEMRPRDQRYIEVLSALVRSLAASGNAVIVGRGGQALLTGRDDALHVRVVCDLDERIRRIAERDGMTPQAARARVEDSDRQRAAWHHKYFGVNYESPYLYHLVLNSGRLSDEVAAGFVMQLVRAMTLRPEPSAERRAVSGTLWGEPAAEHGKQDWGWIELLQTTKESVDARAHLFATEIRPDGEWRGHLESIHLPPGLSSLSPGTYYARFARSGTDHVVNLEVTEQGTQVHSDDREVPAIFRERSEG